VVKDMNGDRPGPGQRERQREGGVLQKKGYVMDIKWNALDAIISLVFLAAILVGIYFGSAKLFVLLQNEQFFNSSNINNISFTVLYGIQVILMLGVVWFFALHRRKAHLRDLGLRYYSIAKTIWYSFLSLLAIFFISFLYVFLMNSIFGMEAPSSKIEVLVENRSISSNILLIVVALVAPFSEEIFFRGFVYSAFKKSWGVNAGLFLSSFLFALVHLEIYSFIPLMIIGWLLAYLFEKTKSLMPAIFLHGVYNLILILILLGRLEIIKLY
jgi:membrane protease YdiL (CAAX protease family)